MLTFYYHPLASFCWKPLIALYECGADFERVVVDLGDEASRNAFYKLWPIGKMPVLQDAASGAIVPESTVVIEYLAKTIPAAAGLIPVARDIDVRFKDRFYDNYLQLPMQAIVADRLRPAGAHDPHGVTAARAQIKAALDWVETDMSGRTWACGDDFTMADCAAAPALYYADKVAPFAETHLGAYGYLERLKARPSFARVLEEAEPFMGNFPTQNLN
ncbi:MAG: glutathione S-transferase family protein [Caulobacterales bacterium]